jgi:hypothetical protein
MHSKRIVGVLELNDSEPPLHFLIHNNDRKFTDAFDTLFESEGLLSFTPPTRHPMNMSNAGYGLPGKSAWTLSSP